VRVHISANSCTQTDRHTHNDGQNDQSHNLFQRSLHSIGGNNYGYILLQEKLVRAMFTHSLLYPARPMMSSLLDPRLVLPSSGAGAPSVAFPPPAGSQTATLPPFFTPPPLAVDRDPLIVRHSGMVNETPRRLQLPSADRFTEPSSGD